MKDELMTVTEAAKLLGITRERLRFVIVKYHIEVRINPRDMRQKLVSRKIIEAIKVRNKLSRKEIFAIDKDIDLWYYLNV